MTDEPLPGWKFWSPERDDLLRQHHDAGDSFSVISKKLGVSKNAAIGRARRLELARRSSPIKRAGPAKPYQRSRHGTRGKLSVADDCSLPALSSLEESDSLFHPPEPIALEMPSKGRPTLPEQAPVAVQSRCVDGCRYPLWGDDPNERPTHRYCDAPRISGKSWCPEHFRIVFTKVRWGEAA